ncbi:MAG: hypothetical protein LC687_05710 [Actinobacteria bacterium]|nr:hypothetical protein [Actinomycetota bacterium]
MRIQKTIYMKDTGYSETHTYNVTLGASTANRLIVKLLEELEAEEITIHKKDRTITVQQAPLNQYRVRLTMYVDAESAEHAVEQFRDAYDVEPNEVEDANLDT